jgi:hypothetical protein
LLISPAAYEPPDSTFCEELCRTRGMQLKSRDITYSEMDALWNSCPNENMEARIETYFDLLYERQTLAKRFDAHAYLGDLGYSEEVILEGLANDDDDEDDLGMERTRDMFERVYCNFLEKQMISWPRGSCKFCEPCMTHFPNHDGSYVSFWPPRKYLYKTANHQQWIEVYGACRECDSNKEWIRTRGGDY